MMGRCFLAERRETMRPSESPTKIKGEYVDGEMYVSDNGKNLVIQFCISENPSLKGIAQRKHFRDSMLAIYHVVMEYVDHYGKFEECFKR